MRRKSWFVRRRRKSPAAALVKGVSTLTTTALAAAGGWILYSNFVVDHNLPLGKAIDADTRAVTSEDAGEINYYEDRKASGRPLLLIHSVNAAASSYEMGPIFNRYRTRRPVIAVDLPGFGLSDRSDRIYSPRVYHEAILDVLHAAANEPVDVVALSLGCEFAARAAVIEPELFNSLALISPTGFSARPTGPASQRASREGKSDRAFRLLSTPLWGRPLYDLLVTRPSLRYFLQRSFVGPVPEDMVDYAYATGHQPGAEHAPLNFLSGRLFTDGILPAFYERLEMPVLVAYDQDGYTRFDLLPEVVAGHENWRSVRIEPTRGLPQFEQMDALAEALDGFWAARGA